MSESEALEAIGIYVANAHSSFSLYITFVFGFLVVAYLAGSDLSRFQALVASVIFTFAASATAVSLTANLQAFATLMEKNPTPLDSIPLYDGTLWLVTMSVVLWPGILVCLLFMWDVRKVKPISHLEELD